MSVAEVKEDFQEVSDNVKAAMTVEPGKWRKKAIEKIVMHTLGIFIAFFMGSWGFSILWLVLLAMYRLRATIREDENISYENRVKFQRAMHKSELLQAFMKTAPTWVDFSDREKAHWFMCLLRQLWPYAKTATEDSIRSSVSPLLDSYRPAFLNKFHITTLDFGPYPPSIRGVRAVPQAAENTVTLDMSIRLDTSTNIVIGVGAGPIALDVKLANLVVAGTIRLTLDVLQDNWPCFSALTFGFTESPEITFNLDAGAIPLSRIPGVAGFLDSFLGTTLAGLFVFPKKLVIPLVDPTFDAASNALWDQTQLLYDESPVGLLHVVLRSGKNLMNTETVSKSDPYCRLSLGGIHYTSRVVSSNLDPVFDQAFEFVVHDRTLQTLQIQVMDSEGAMSMSKLSKDKPMGDCSISLADLDEQEYLAKWYGLSNATSGELNIELVFCPVLYPQELQQQQARRIPNAHYEGGLLVVTVHGATGLKNDGVTPMCQLDLFNETSGAKHDTRMSTIWPESFESPVYNEKFYLFLEDIRYDTLRVSFGGAAELQTQDDRTLLGGRKNVLPNASIDLSDEQGNRKLGYMVEKLMAGSPKSPVEMGTVKLTIDFRPIMTLTDGVGFLSVTVHKRTSASKIPFDLFVNHKKQFEQKNHDEIWPDVEIADWRMAQLSISAAIKVSKSKAPLKVEAWVPVGKIVHAPDMELKNLTVEMTESVEIVCSFKWRFADA